MASTYQNFLKNSQKKISELRQKLESLSQRDPGAAEEKAILKTIHKSGPEVRVALSADSAFKAALAVIGAVALAYVLFFIRDTIIIFLVALFLSAAFGPAVDRMERLHVPRAIGILLMYVLVLGLLVYMITSLVPIIAEQITKLALTGRDMIQNLVSSQGSPNSPFMKKMGPLFAQAWQNIDQSQVISTVSNTLQDVGAKLTLFAGNAIGAVFSIFNGILNLILVMMICFFMMLSKENTAQFFQSLFPVKHSSYITLKTRQIGHRIGEWVRGQMILALCMGVLAFTAFSIIGLNYALKLSMVAALAEFIPYLGPFITFCAAILIGLNQEPVLVLWLLPIYAVITFIEANILAPIILGKSVGLNPVIVLFALLSGATLGSAIGGGSIGLGVVGMIVAVPMAKIIALFVEDYTMKNK